MDIQLKISDLHVAAGAREILRGITLTLPKGQIHAIMGPNGSGKSTLAQALCGHPKYQITKGTAVLKGQNLLKLSPDKRANLGLFLAFQLPPSVPGVKISSFLKQTMNTQRRTKNREDKGLKIREYRELLDNTMEQLHMKNEFAERYLNEGFSGGEKKKGEILQLAMLKPDIAILDEIDSGLDVDALRIVCKNIQEIQNKHHMGILIITHYPRILRYLKPDVVHVMIDGRIVQSGNAELAHTIEEKGYEAITTV